MRPQHGKQKLFDSAMALFESQGYFATTVEQITAEAGVSKGLVYNYFNSKEELLIGLIEDATSRMASVAGTLEPQGPVEESIELFINRFFDFLQTEKRFLKLQLTLLLMPELKDIVAEPQRQRSELLLEQLSSWLKKSNIPRAKKKARLLLALLDGVALHFLCIYERYPLSSMKKQFVQAAKDVCTNRTGE